MKKINWRKCLSYFVMMSLIFSIVFIVMTMIAAPSVADPNQPHVRIKSDYVLMLSQCIVGVFAMLLPGLLKKKINLEIPSNMIILYVLFLYCAIYLGEVRSFYYTVPHWDTILHTFSGAMLGALGFSFVSFLNNAEKVPMHLSPMFVVVFAFCFAITLGVVWEVYEFTADGLLGTNMQKFGLEDGTGFIGRVALVDTMKDLIVDAVGAFVMSVIGYISLKYKKGWVENLLLEIRR